MNAGWLNSALSRHPPRHPVHSGLTHRHGPDACLRHCDDCHHGADFALGTRELGALNVLDDPGARKVHSQPIPRVGGIAMVAGAVLPLCLWLPHRTLPTLLAYLLAVLVAAGVWRLG